MDKNEIIDKITDLLAVETVFRLLESGDIDCGEESFGAKVTLTYLQNKITPLLKALRKEIK